MTEKSLFKTTLITLGATILAPFVVGMTNIAGTSDSVSDKLQNYVTAARTTTIDKKDDANKDDKSTDTKASNEKDADNKESDNSSSNKAVPVGDATTKSAGTYTVKEGDTYGCIAEKYYGSYDQWTRVYDVNAGWAGFNEYDLAVGAQLQMPTVNADQVLPKTSLCQ